MSTTFAVNTSGPSSLQSVGLKFTLNFRKIRLGANDTLEIFVLYFLRNFYSTKIALECDAVFPLFMRYIAIHFLTMISVRHE